MSAPLNVYQCIAAVSAELAKTGIGKDRRNETQGYQFRGVDDVYNALAPVLARVGLVILPRILSRVCVERATTKGGTLFSVTVEAEYDFVSIHDGSTHTARTFGEAMDSGDKATNKAMSAAYKYVAVQAFSIPTKGDNDADAQTHEPAAAQHRPTPPAAAARRPPAPAAAQHRPTPPAVAGKPAGYDQWLAGMEATAGRGSTPLQLAWFQSSKTFRHYLRTTNLARWQTLKKKAERVSA